MKVEVFYNEGCQKCRMTIDIFKRKGVKVIATPMTDEIISKSKERGWRVAPIVQVTDDDNTLLDEWNDFRVDKINRWGK